MTYPTISPKLTLDFANSRQLDPRITFSRSSSATYIHPDTGLITTALDGVARFEKEGLLVEEARTNLIPYSEDLASWASNTAVTLTSFATQSPDGSLTATRFQEDTANNRHQIRQTVSSSYSSGNKYSLTVFAKSGVNDQVFLYFASADFSFGQVTFDLTNLTYNVAGAGTSARITSYPDGWKKLEVTATATATGTSIPIHIGRNDTFQVGDPNEDFYIWGAQLEAGSYPTSYIPTAGSTVTRAADLASITGASFSDWYNQGEGIVVVDYAYLGLPDSSALNTAFSVQTGAGSPQIILAAYGFNSRMRVLTFGDGDIYPATIFGSTDLRRCGVGYETNNLSFIANGATLGTDTTYTTATAIDRLVLDNGNGGTPCSKHLRRLSYYDRRVSDAALEVLTS